MDYTKYYTPPQIAEFLITHLDIKMPSKTIDICCGSCNLLHAVKKRWKKTKLYGIDIIDLESHDVEYIKSDGRKFAIDNNSKFELIVANPPFDRLKKRGEFKKLFENLPFKYTTSRLEIEMLLANLKILKENGTLMIIMPITFAIGNTNIKLKKFLAKHYSIKKIFYLPDDVFGTANIASCALIINNSNEQSKKTMTYTIESCSDGYKLTDGKELSQNIMETGIWHTKANNNVFSKKIRRGNISSHYFTDKGMPILHIAKLAEEWIPSTRYVTEVNETAVYANSGDIIISRIGKSAGRWYKYKGSRMPISDCLFVIPDNDNTIENVLAGHEYPYNHRGVATKYITKSDIAMWFDSLLKCQNPR